MTRLVLDVSTPKDQERLAKRIAYNFHLIADAEPWDPIYARGFPIAWYQSVIIQTLLCCQQVQQHASQLIHRSLDVKQWCYQTMTLVSHMEERISKAYVRYEIEIRHLGLVFGDMIGADAVCFPWHRLAERRWASLSEPVWRDVWPKIALELQRRGHTDTTANYWWTLVQELVKACLEFERYLHSFLRSESIAAKWVSFEQVIRHWYVLGGLCYRLRQVWRYGLVYPLAGKGWPAWEAMERRLGQPLGEVYAAQPDDVERGVGTACGEHLRQLWKAVCGAYGEDLEKAFKEMAYGYLTLLSSQWRQVYQLIRRLSEVAQEEQDEGRTLMRLFNELKELEYVVKEMLLHIHCLGARELCRFEKKLGRCAGSLLGHRVRERDQRGVLGLPEGEGLEWMGWLDRGLEHCGGIWGDRAWRIAVVRHGLQVGCRYEIALDSLLRCGHCEEAIIYAIDVYGLVWESAAVLWDLENLIGYLADVHRHTLYKEYNDLWEEQWRL